MDILRSLSSYELVYPPQILAVLYHFYMKQVSIHLQLNQSINIQETPVHVIRMRSTNLTDGEECTFTGWGSDTWVRTKQNLQL
jgi:hypothetical protein